MTGLDILAYFCCGELGLSLPCFWSPWFCWGAEVGVLTGVDGF